MSSASPPNTTTRIMLLYFYSSPHPLHIMILESLGDRELEPGEKNFLLPSGRNFRMTESVEKFRIMVPCQWGIAYFFLYCEENLIYREHTREPKYHTSHFLLILSFLRQNFCVLKNKVITGATALRNEIPGYTTVLRGQTKGDFKGVD